MPLSKCLKKTFTLSQKDFNLFADLSGDHNPIHIDPAYSAETRFGATVSHGMLLFTLIKGATQKLFPEYEMIEQELMFPAPAYADEELTLLLENTNSLAAQDIVLKTRIIKADGSACLEGQCRLNKTTGNF